MGALLFIARHWKPIAGALALAVIVWRIDAYGDRRDAEGYDRRVAEEQAAAVAALAEVANDNAAAVLEVQARADVKAAAVARRKETNWERSERLNHELYAKVAAARPGPCDAADIPAIAVAVDGVWREAARAGDPRATGDREGGAGSDGAVSGAAAAAPEGLSGR